MRITLLIQLILYVPFWSIGQELYYSSTSDLPGGDNIIRTGILNLNTCESEVLYSDTTNLQEYLEWIDIALCPDGNLYGVGWDGIYLIDPYSKSHSKILDRPSYPRWRRGMHCNKDTVLVFGELDMFSYDIPNTNLIHLGRIPTSLQIWSNIFEFQGMFMASSNSEIVKLDLVNPMLSTQYCVFSLQGFLSLTEVAISCDSVANFALFNNGEVYLFDPLTCGLTYYCSVSRHVDESFQGSSPNFMFMPPDPCRIHLDLDLFDETASGVDFLDTVYCTLPSPYLVSPLDLVSDKPWDSLHIWIESGPPDIFLMSSNTPYATIQGLNTSHLDFRPNGIANLDVLGPVLSQLTLTGNIPSGFTPITIAFSAWADGLTSDTAYAFLTLAGRSTQAGDNSNIWSCSSDSEFALSSLLSTDATPGGIWIPATQVSGRFNPALDSPGIYHYIVSDPVCLPDTSDHQLEVYPPVDYSLGPDQKICGGDTICYTITIPDATISWSDGTISPTACMTQPGMLSVAVLDGNVCLYMDSVYLYPDPECAVKNLYFPNIFSPDGNGINDFWTIIPNAEVAGIELEIFDRWGSLLFSSNGLGVTWDGRDKNGKAALQGVYIFKAIITSVYGSQTVTWGNITVIR